MGGDGHLSFGRKLVFSAAGLGLLVLLLGALVAAGELVLRTLEPKSDPAKLGVRLPGADRPYGLQPNYRGLHIGVQVQTNSLGFREREYPIERRPGVGRIVVLGDSYTFGAGAPFEEIYPKHLEAALNRARGPFEVINFGVSGYNTTMELAVWREVAARFSPDLVILGYVLNDTERWDPVEGQGSGGRDPSALDALHAELKRRSVLYRYLAPKIGAVFALFGARYAVGSTHDMIASFAEDAPGWIESRAALLELRAEVEAGGARLLVVVFPMLFDFERYPLRRAHETVVGFCERHGIEALDLLPALRGRDPASLAVFLDGHPNGEGHRLFAEAIFARLGAGGFLPAPPRH